MEAIADPPVHERGAVRHDDIVRDLVHRLKYGDRLDLATSMGQWMARAGRKLLIDADAPPEGPAARRSRWTGGGCGRRFNQASATRQGGGIRQPSPGPRHGPQARARHIAAVVCRAVRGS